MICQLSTCQQVGNFTIYCTMNITFTINNQIVNSHFAEDKNILPKRVYILFFVLVLLVGCSSQNIEPALTFELPEAELPLAEPGPYEFSTLRGITYFDDDRNGKEVSIDIYYPSKDGEPDLRGAPFPVIMGTFRQLIFAHQLASHGFIVVGLNLPSNYSEGDEVIHQPLDFISVLNQLAENPPDLLADLIDTDHVGHWGYSGGGRTSLTLAGAQIDPDYYFEICENSEITDIDYGPDLQFICDPYENWDVLIDEAGPFLVETDDGLLRAITDERIIATIPMSSGGEWLYGATGLASADKAVLLTVGQFESPRTEETHKIFDELGTSEKVFITFMGKNHNMVFENDAQVKMQHLAIAFFSYYLKGYEEYGAYFSEEFISQVEGLAWGWYEE